MSQTTAVAVSTVMNQGVIDAPPQSPLSEVAAQMAEHGIHCVVVDGIARSGRGERLVWGILSDRDLLKAAAAGCMDASAGDFAATEITTIDSNDSIETAVQLMAAHESTHLVVVSPDSGTPVGVISSLDVAGVLSGAR